MPPFHYDPSYAATLGDLTRSNADAVSHAAAMRGNAAVTRANAIGGAASSFMGTLGDIYKYKAEKPMRDAQLAHQRALVEEEQALASQRRDATADKQRAQTDETAAGGVYQSAFRKDKDGQSYIDRGWLAQTLANAKIGPEEQQRRLKMADDLNEHVKKVHEAKTDALANFSYSVLTDSDPKAWDFHREFGLRSGLVTEDDVKPYDELASSDPAMLKTALTQVVQSSPKYAALLKKDETPRSDYASALKRFESGLDHPMTAADEIDFKARFDAAGRAPVRPAAAPNPTEASLALQAAQGDAAARKALDLLQKTRGDSAADRQKTENTALADAVMVHPDLWTTLTDSAKTSITPMLHQRGFTGFGSQKTLTPSEKAVVERWRYEQLSALKKEFAVDAKGSIAPERQAEYEAAKQGIEDGYRAQLGGAPPRGSVFPAKSAPVAPPVSQPSATPAVQVPTIPGRPPGLTPAPAPPVSAPTAQPAAPSPQVLLKGKPAGTYHLTDGSSWRVNADGTVAKVH